MAEMCNEETVYVANNTDKPQDRDPEEKSEERIHYEASTLECAVCLQSWHHPVRLPCKHIFCFLCVKGVAARSHKCALCRAEIPDNYFENPTVVKVKDGVATSKASSALEIQKDAALYRWFYEGRNGWWQYEARASDQVEEEFSTGKQSTEILIAGFAYIIDIENMVQYRKDYPTRRRRIKRDKPQADKKGVAGLKYSTENRNGVEQIQETMEQKQNLDSSSENKEVLALAEKLEKKL